MEPFHQSREYDNMHRDLAMVERMVQNVQRSVENVEDQLTVHIQSTEEMFSNNLVSRLESEATISRRVSSLESKTDENLDRTRQLEHNLGRVQVTDQKYHIVDRKKFE